MTYLMKASHPKRGRGSVISTEDLQVSFARRYRPKRDLGFATEVEPAGIDRKRLDLHAREALRGDGSKAYDSWARNCCEASAAALKRLLRRLRPQDTEEIRELDERLAAKWGELEELQSCRDEAVRRAFSKGHVVTLAEVLGKANAFGEELRDR